jgi:flagellin
MTSINYSAASSSAIRALQSVNRDLAATQNRISTGYKVNSAADNATIWSAASSLRSDVKAYDAAKSSMDFAKGLYSSSAASASAVSDLVTQIKTVLTTGLASASGSTARTNAQSQLSDLQAQLKAIVADAGVGGVNLITGGATPSILSGFSSSAATTSATVSTVNLNATTIGKLSYVDATNYGDDAAAADATLLTLTIDGVETAAQVSTALTNITTVAKNASDYASTLANAATRIQSNQDYLSKIADIKKSALSSLVDADMEEESAKLSALQVKQQLATQALSIANQSGQYVLRLFQ